MRMYSLPTGMSFVTKGFSYTTKGFGYMTKGFSQRKRRGETHFTCGRKRFDVPEKPSSFHYISAESKRNKIVAWPSKFKN